MHTRTTRTQVTAHGPRRVGQGLTAIRVSTGILLGLCATASAQFYQKTNLVSDVPSLASVLDTNLVGAWGTAHGPTSPWWVNTTRSGLSLLFNGAGQPLPLVVAIPPTNGASATGIAFNSGAGFEVAMGEPAAFIFATLNGTISGWNPSQADRNLAILEVNNAGKASYAGITIDQRSGADYLYAANFKQDRVDVFDTKYQPVTLPAGAFEDNELPDGVSVFNVQAVGSDLYVTYAPTNTFTGPNQAGDGYVTVFDADGKVLRRLKHGPWMNSPWGVTLAPGDFGRFSNQLLVGMFGNGQIAAFDADNVNFRGLLRGTDGAPLTISKGLWGLGFGNGASAGPTNALYFATDIVINKAFHGIFGVITAAPSTEEENDMDHGRGADHGNKGGRGHGRGQKND